MRILVVGFNEPPDNLYQIRHVFERTTANLFVRDFAEPSLHHVEPGRGSGNEVKTESRMAFQPRLDSGMFVSSVVVHDQMQSQVGRCLDVDKLQKTDELLMPVPRHTVSDNFAIQHA